jgi:hypothetical protein
MPSSTGDDFEGEINSIVTKSAPTVPKTVYLQTSQIEDPPVSLVINASIISRYAKAPTVPIRRDIVKMVGFAIVADGGQ